MSGNEHYHERYLAQSSRRRSKSIFPAIEATRCKANDYYDNYESCQESAYESTIQRMIVAP